MHHTRVKICGVRDIATAKAAALAGVHAVGLVFVDGSPRQVAFEQAGQIVASLPPFVEPVALFVDAPLDHVRKVSKALGLRTVQLHGKETPEFVMDLAPLRVIKAVNFDPRHVTDALAPWRRECSNLAGLLFDAPPPEQEDALPGGTGRALDWQGLAKLEHAGMLADLPPTLLAGGLNPDNVGRAIATVEPYAVDVSSGVESSPGIKNHGLIQQFCEAVRAANDGVKSSTT